MCFDGVTEGCPKLYDWIWKIPAFLKTKFILVLIGSVSTYLERENDLKHSLRMGQIPEFQ